MTAGEIVNPKIGGKITLSIKEPADYFKLSDLWAKLTTALAMSSRCYMTQEKEYSRISEDGLKAAGAKCR